MSWREVAKPIIATVLEETKDLPSKEQRTALRTAYPFGQRKFWPYKVWLSEIRRQRDGWTPPNRKKDRSNPNQLDLPYPTQITISEVYGDIEIS